MRNSQRIKIFLVVVANDYDNLDSCKKHRRGNNFQGVVIKVFSLVEVDFDVTEKIEKVVENYLHGLCRGFRIGDRFGGS